MTTVQIDLNVRVRGDQTFSAFRHIVGARPAVGDTVDVLEPESYIGGTATVTDIDVEKGIIYLAVQWAELFELEPVPTSYYELLPAQTYATSATFRPAVQSYRAPVLSTSPAYA